MSQKSHAAKVGLFVMVGLVLLAILLLSFSKGLSVLTPSFHLNLKAKSVGGLRKNANVLLSGVPVGRVSGFDVSADGMGVVIRLQIEEKYANRIHSDARFTISQLGLLGDQYIEITPQDSKGQPVRDDQMIEAQDPMSLQETARSAKDLIALASQTLTSFNRFLERVDKTVLSEQSLTNLAAALDQFKAISERASGMVNNIDNLVQTNTPAITSSISNLNQFSVEMQRMANEMTMVVSSNRMEFTRGVKNLEQASQALQRLVKEIESGQGTAGLILKDPEFRYNISQVASNLQLFSRHLNSHGLFHNLFFKPKPPKPPKEAKK